MHSISLIQFLRRHIAKDSFVRRLWRAARLPSQRVVPPEEAFLAMFASCFPEAFFIQIGSNDGVGLDPLRAQLHQSKWRGVMIEPVPHIFQQLQKNCASYADRISFQNVAIANTDGVLPFYYLRPAGPSERAGLPHFYDMLGSFNKNVILSHITDIPDIEERVVCVDIKALSFESLCNRLCIRSIDLLHIDAEGYDFEILKTIDFRRHQPIVLIYEHHHLGKDDRLDCAKRLEAAGYELASYGLDTWCLLVERLPQSKKKQMIRAWARFKNAVSRP